MILTVRVHNAWENERWTYILDISKQKAEALKWLMIFIRIANNYFDESKEAAPERPFSNIPFIPRGPKLFAAEHYHFDFYDSVKEDDKCFRLKQGDSILQVSKRSGYKSSQSCLDLVISPARMKSAAVTMRDKKENKLYKNFEYLFLKQKQKTSV